MAVKKLASETLDFMLALCKSSHPREFGALLEAEGDTITHVIYLPGTDATTHSVSLKTWMMPNMPSAGSFHSHPSGVIRPSEQDLIFFRAYEINIIVGEPYTRDSWKAFDNNGNRIELEVADYKFDDYRFNYPFEDDEDQLNDENLSDENLSDENLSDENLNDNESEVGDGENENEADRGYIYVK